MNLFVKSIFTVCFCFLLGCTSEEDNYVILSGNVSNLGEGFLSLTDVSILTNYNDSTFAQSFDVDENGSFRDTFEITEGAYLFSFRKGFIELYLEPGNDMQISLNLDDAINTAKFEGDGAIENNIKLAVLKIDDFTNQAETYRDQSAYLELNNLFLDSTQALIDNAGCDASFKAFIKKEVVYRYAYYIADFEVMEEGTNFSEAYNKMSIPLYDSVEFVSSYYYGKYMFSYFLSQVYLVSDHRTDLKAIQRTCDAAVAELDNVKDENVKDYLIEQELYYWVSDMSAGIEAVQIYHDAIMEVSNNDEFKKEVADLVTGFKTTIPGSASPGFSYENLAGDEVTLESLKGKYVYLDLWATWCVPCLREIPSLKVLEEEYHGKKVEFVGVSLDRENARDKWEAMLIDKELDNIQLWSANSDSKFIESYQVNSIPRFILIDPDGNIVNSDAPRPSSNAIRGLLESLEI
ncbi:MAG: TlpA family protein disulfide reductase [Flavobacteriales bacterium]|nr:TlpA family protein disulfide reductase [Flavobacteriales bacterium]